MLSSYRGNSSAPTGGTSGKPILVTLSGQTSAVPVILTHANTPYQIPDNLTSGQTYLADTSGGALEIDLPVNPTAGQVINIKRQTTDGTALTIGRSNASIEGAASNIVDTNTTLSEYSLQYDSVSNSWWIIGESLVPPAFANQTANKIFAGPTSGGAAAPTFRAAVAADIPGTLGATAFSGTVTPQGLVDISGASAGQIKFPATQNPSANANTLDDYEEGTFTPTDASGAGLSFTNNSGTYTKIGNMVIAGIAVTYPATADGSTAYISLPFVVTASSNFCNSAGGSGRTDLGSQAIPFADPGASRFANLQFGTTAGLLNSALSTKTITARLPYQTT